MNGMEAGPSSDGIVRRLLGELDYPVSQFRPEHQELRSQFEAVAEPLAQGLVGHRSAEGHLGFAINQILVRATTDLVAAFHLTMHGYLNQAYNEMRMGYEACALTRLVAEAPAEATRWIESDKPWSEFSPSAVRSRLNEPRVDEIYSHLCGLAHPRFSGTDLTGYATKNPAGETTSNFSLGPSPLLDERPHLAFAASFAGICVGRVVISVGYLVSVGGLDEDAWDRMVAESREALAVYLASTMRLMATSGFPKASEEIGAMEKIILKPLNEILGAEGGKD